MSPRFSAHKGFTFIYMFRRFRLSRETFSKTRTCCFDYLSFVPLSTRSLATKCTVVRSKQDVIFDYASTHGTASPISAHKRIQAKSTTNRPISIFPWRHDIKPFPRYSLGTAEWRNDIVLTRTGQKLLAYIFLNMPAWQYFFRNWEKELADSFAFAFTQGVSGILSNVYSLDKESVLRKGNDLPWDSFKIDFSYPIKKKNRNIKDKNMSGAIDVSVESKNVQDTKTSVVNDDIVNGMVTVPLRKLFQSAYENGKDQFDIRLKTEPLVARILNIWAIPFVSREALERNPGIVELFSGPFSFENCAKFHDYYEKELKLKNYLETTVEVHVVILSKEVFHIRDRSTGAVIPGSSDGMLRNVIHIVRFERIVQTRPSQTFPFYSSQCEENWKLVDIDDLLESKPWFRLHKNLRRT